MSITIWFICGLICTVITMLYDIITNKTYSSYFNFGIIRMMCLMILLGVFSIPIAIYLILSDIGEKIKRRKC